MDFIPAKGSRVYYGGDLGIVERRQGAKHVTVRTEVRRSSQDFITLKVTEFTQVVKRTWPVAELSATPPVPAPPESPDPQAT